MPFGFEKTARGTWFPSFHVHDEFSIKDGCSSVRAYAKNIVELGGDSLCVTNHGMLGGAAAQFFACQKAKLKPIYGIEAYVNERRHLRDRLEEGLKAATKLVKQGRAGAAEKKAQIQAFTKAEFRPGRHLLLVARNRTGYRNLVRISSDAWINGFYYAPRTDSKFLAEHAEGLICSTACIGGVVPKLAREVGFDAAIAKAREFQAIFGPENFFVELMATAYDKQRETNEIMLRLAHEIGAKTIITTDVHYSRPEDQLAQRCLLLMRDGKTIQAQDAGEGGWQFESKDLYWKSLEDVVAVWNEHHKDYWPKEDFQRALKNTYELAASIESWEFDQSLKLPGIFDNSVGLLRELVKKGLASRKERGHLPCSGKTLRDYAQRAAYELSIIESKGFSEYLLVLWDLCRHAREIGSRMGPGRGSAGASLVAFLLDITQIDPLRFNLFFERFLDPSRKDAPDVDLDFSPEHRDPIKKYLEKKYPTCATIGTYSTFKTRSTIQAVGAVFGLERADLMRITKPLGEVSAQDLDDMSFDDVVERWPGVKELAEKNPQAWGVVKTLDGLVSHRGQHASGVLVGPASLLDEVPMIKDPRTGVICTAFPDTSVQGGGTDYEGREVSKLGCIKIDVLGQNTLNVAAGALELLERDTGETIDLTSIPLDDPESLALASRADVPGVFQFDTSTSRPLLLHVGVDRFEDLAAITALARPGPLGSRLHERFAKLKRSDAWKSLVPEAVHQPLEASCGLMIYQEDVMLTLVHVGGFSMEEANAVRKIVAKKLDPALLEHWKGEFVRRGIERGHARPMLEKVFADLEAYCKYAFAKPHAIAYAREAYDQLYVFARFPLHYFASLLRTTERKKKGGRGEDALVGHLRSAMQHGISILPPSILRSEDDFDVDGGAIRYGLAKIKGVGHGGEAASELRAMLEEDGALSSLTLETFVGRVDKRCNAGAVKALIFAGAFDDVAFDQAELDDLLEEAQEEPILRRNALLARHAFLTRKSKRKPFERPTAHAAGVLEQHERELLGVLLSFWSGSFPRAAREALGLRTIREELDRDARRLTLLVEVARCRTHSTGRGDMAFLTLADETGTLDNVVLFSSTWKVFKDKLRLGKIATIRLERRESRDERYGKWSYFIDERSSGPAVEGIVGLRRRLRAVPTAAA
jgi:DNA polymerase-3 subunit alpha